MDREAWEKGIGRFMLAAGVVELRMIQLMWNISIPHEHDKGWITLNFSRKIKKVKELANQSELPEYLSSRLRSVLGETKAVMDIRNIIAHNPLSATSAFEKFGWKSELRLQVLRNSEESFSFEDLSDAIKRVERLDEELMDLVCDDKLWSWSLNKAKQKG